MGGLIRLRIPNWEVVFRVCVYVACARDATQDQGVSRHVFVFLLLLLLLLLLGGPRPDEKKTLLVRKTENDHVVFVPSEHFPRFFIMPISFDTLLRRKMFDTLLRRKYV